MFRPISPPHRGGVQYLPLEIFGNSKGWAGQDPTCFQRKYGLQNRLAAEARCQCPRAALHHAGSQTRRAAAAEKIVETEGVDSLPRCGRAIGELIFDHEVLRRLLRWAQGSFGALERTAQWTHCGWLTVVFVRHCQGRSERTRWRAPPAIEGHAVGLSPLRAQVSRLVHVDVSQRSPGRPLRYGASANAICAAPWKSLKNAPHLSPRARRCRTGLQLAARATASWALVHGFAMLPRMGGCVTRLASLPGEADANHAG